MLKKLNKILIPIIFLVILLSIGGVFATWTYLSPEANGQGGFGFSMERKRIVYITDAVQVTGGTGTATVNGYNETTLGSTITLNSNKNTYTTVKITVYNNALETYAYNAVKYHASEYSNSDIVYELPVLRHGDEIAPGESLEFEVVFAYKAGVRPSNYVLTSFLNFEFTPLDELPPEEQIAVSGALGQFKAILNGETISDSLAQLTTQMDDYNANDRHDGSYIGNVSGATEEDVGLLENLFQGNLTLLIDGVETEVTILIKRQNIDSDLTTGDASGNEMTIYMTTDSLAQT